jgi:translation initiation factor 2D
MQAAGKGKLLEVLQHYGDTLWQTLGKAAAPNDGFQQGFVAPTDLVAEATAAAVAAAEAGEEAAAAGDGGSADASTAGAAAAVTAAGLEQLSLNGTSSSSNGGPPAAAAGQQPEADSSSSSPDRMDQLLEVSLLQALLKSVKDADLPLSSSSLWSQHIKPCRPLGSELDVKRSSHKKMSKFLQVGLG